MDPRMLRRLWDALRSAWPATGTSARVESSTVSGHGHGGGQEGAPVEGLGAGQEGRSGAGSDDAVSAAAPETAPSSETPGDEECAGSGPLRERGIRPATSLRESDPYGAKPTEKASLTSEPWQASEGLDASVAAGSALSDEGDLGSVASSEREVRVSKPGSATSRVERDLRGESRDRKASVSVSSPMCGPNVSGNVGKGSSSQTDFVMFVSGGEQEKERGDRRAGGAVLGFVLLLVLGVVGFAARAQSAPQAGPRMIRYPPPNTGPLQPQGAAFGANQAGRRGSGINALRQT